MRPARILVVDDEPAIRALVAKIAQRAGFDVHTARDGAEAIEKLGIEHFDVLIVDLMMPHVDGYAVVDHLRGRTANRPAVIVVTAGDSSAIRRLDGSLVHSVIRKPFDIDVLGDLIGAAAESSRETRAAGDVIPFPKRDAVC